MYECSVSLFCLLLRLQISLVTQRVPFWLEQLLGLSVQKEKEEKKNQY